VTYIVKKKPELLSRFRREQINFNDFSININA
jgi:hypothetical protein